jgi:hypothetical protein
MWRTIFQWGMIAGAICVASYIYARLVAAATNRRLRNRQPVTIEDCWANSQFRKSMEFNKFEEHFREIAGLVGVNPTKIRLADRFDDELREPSWSFGLPVKHGVELYIESLVRLKGVVMTSDNLPSLQSIEDALIIVAKIESKA